MDRHSKIAMGEAMIIAPPPTQKFTLDEWHTNNQIRYHCSEQQQRIADSFRNKCERMCELTSDNAKLNKEETDHRLREKIGDIEDQKRELLILRKEILLENDALATMKNRLIDALFSIRKNALVICQKCLIARERRLGIDLVQDSIEVELRKECKIIEGADQLLVRMLEQIQEQIRRLKATLYYMDRDIEDKDRNIQIDKRNLSLKETSFNLSIYHGTTRLDPSNITLNEWEMQTHKNIVTAAKEINSAIPLRCYIDAILKEITSDLNIQKEATDEAFEKRIAEIKEAKEKLELQHSEAIRQAHEMTIKIANIEKSIVEKESFIALAHTRLGNRCHRPGLEMTRDQVEVSLVREIVDLQNVAAKLQRTLIEAQASLRYLRKTQIQLEEDINIKVNSLQIDEVECMTLRHSVHHYAY